MGSSGRLITANDIADGLIVNADVNANANIAVGKLANMLVGNVLKGGATANAPGQITNADVLATAGIDYAKLNLANRLATADLTAYATYQYVDGPLANGTGGGAPAWAYAGAYCDLAVTSTASLVLAFFQGTVINGAINQAIYMGVGPPDSASSAAGSVSFSAAVITGAPFLVYVPYFGLSGAHRFYTVYGVQGGGQSAYFQNIRLSMLELKR